MAGTIRSVEVLLSQNDVAAVVNDHLRAISADALTWQVVLMVLNEYGYTFEPPADDLRGSTHLVVPVHFLHSYGMGVEGAGMLTARLVRTHQPSGVSIGEKRRGRQRNKSGQPKQPELSVVKSSSQD